MYCGNCGKKLEEGAAFCPDCGTRVASSQNIDLHNDNIEPAKGIKLPKYILIIAPIAVIIMAVLLYQWYTSAEQRAIRAVEDGDYDYAMEIVNEDDTIFESGKLSKKISKRIAAVKDNYVDEKIDYASAIVELVRLGQLNESDHTIELEEAIDFIDSLNQSRTNFTTAESLYLTGDYIEAIKYYSLVIEDDDNYSTAQDQISKSKDNYRVEVLSRAADLASDELYDEAIVELENALTYLGSNPELENELQIYQKLYDEMEPIIVDTGHWGNSSSGNVTDITWVLDSKGRLTITGTGKMDNSYVSGPWSDYRSSITMITIEEGVSSIGNAAFSGCSEVASVAIPTSVTRIGDNAFSGCTKLTNVMLPSSLIEIDDFAFEDCSGLISIVIPNSVTTIKQHAFSGCTSLSHVTIPASVTKLGMGVFSGCSNLSTAGPFGGDYDIEYSWSSIIPENALRGNQLTSIVIPEGVTEIGSYAFASCPYLEKVIIPASVQKFGNEIYEPSSGSSGYKLFTAGPIGGGYNIEFGWTDIIPTHAFDYCSSLLSIQLPHSVTEIGSYAFNNCRDLKDIVLPSGVTSIGSHAFSGCRSLSNISIPNGVTQIGSDAFSYCIAITDLTIPNSVTRCGGFYSCENLTHVTLSSSMKSLSGTFRKCKNLTSVFIPSSITEFAYEAFYGCDSLTDIYYSGTPDQWNQIRVSSDNDKVLNHVTVHYNSTAN